ncbi:Flp family type IVb pilin [Microbacteriaceae bacterium K1510]|nr:Flp family type IVb pilin [Microbacteriaceae bacterium K1510]
MSKTNVRRFLSNEEGSTAIEYALIASGISIAVVGAVTTLGSQVKTTLYDKLAALF